MPVTISDANPKANDSASLYNEYYLLPQPLPSLNLTITNPFSIAAVVSPAVVDDASFLEMLQRDLLDLRPQVRVDEPLDLSNRTPAHFEEEVAGTDELGSGRRMGLQLCHTTTLEGRDPETQGGAEPVRLLEVVHGGSEGVARGKRVGTDASEVLDGITIVEGPWVECCDRVREGDERS